MISSRRNIKLTIQYDGTHYAGWQYQKNAQTVQGVMESALTGILGKKASLTGSGRTDSGVHAMAQIANFKTYSTLPRNKLQAALNSRLPKDIVVSRVEEADLKFNSQHDARSKLYRYTVANGDFVDPFVRNFAAKCFYRLDVGLMKKEARLLLGRHDFRSFKTNDGEDESGKGSTVRTIKNIRIKKEGPLIYIYIEADGFLYNMARNIVGTLIEVSRGKLPAGSAKRILLKKDRRSCGPTAPAKGLCLMKVRY